MSLEENKALVRRNLELWNKREFAAAGETYALDYVYHGPGGQELRGREGILGLWKVIFDAFPDLIATSEDVIAEGDKVASRWTIRGTHTGEFQGMPPTNREVTLPIIEMFRVENGVLAEAWDMYDQLSFLQAMETDPK